MTQSFEALTYRVVALCAVEYPLGLCGDVSDCKQFAEVTLYGDLSPWCHWPRHRTKQVQRSHDLSNVASNAKEAVPVCQQQENTQPALIRRKSTSGLL